MRQKKSNHGLNIFLTQSNIKVKTVKLNYLIPTAHITDFQIPGFHNT